MKKQTEKTATLIGKKAKWIGKKRAAMSRKERRGTRRASKGNSSGSIVKALEEILRMTKRVDSCSAQTLTYSCATRVKRNVSCSAITLTNRGIHLFLAVFEKTVEKGAICSLQALINSCTKICHPGSKEKSEWSEEKRNRPFRLN